MRYVDYTVYDILGLYDPASGQIGLTSKILHVNTPQRLTATLTKFPHNGTKLQYSTPPHKVPAPARINCNWSEKGFPYVGELGGELNGQIAVMHMPPIPLYSYANAYHTTELDVVIHTWDRFGVRIPSPVPVVNCIHRVLHTDKPYGEFAHTSRFSLAERNPDPHPWMVYDYVFAADLDFMYEQLPLIYIYGYLMGEVVTGYLFHGHMPKDS